MCPTGCYRSNVEDDDALGSRPNRLGYRPVDRVVEVGVPGLRGGEGDDEAVVEAVLQPFGTRRVALDHGLHVGDRVDEAPDGRPDEILSRPWLPLFQETRTIWLTAVTDRAYDPCRLPLTLGLSIGLGKVPTGGQLRSPRVAS